MSNFINRAISHPALALCSTMLGGFFEFIALQRSRWVNFNVVGKRRTE